LDIFSHNGQTFSFCVETSKKWDTFSHNGETFSFYGETSMNPEIKHFLSQWTDIQLLWRNQCNPTKSNSFSHSGQTFLWRNQYNPTKSDSFTVDRHSASMKKPVQTNKVRHSPA
jgi:hypothetical protein